MVFQRTVILFGTSANPPTGMSGHAGLVKWAIDRPSFPELDGRRADEVWVLPVFVHAFEDKRQMPSFEHRVAMAKLAFESLPGAEGRVRVLPTEREVADRMMASVRDARASSVRVGTIDVVRDLRAHHPSTDFALLLGGDTHEDLVRGRWKESEALRSMVRVISVSRWVFGSPRPPSAPSDPCLGHVSSTAVRESSDLEFLRGVLQPEVLEYIREHKLYAFSETSFSRQDSTPSPRQP